MHLSDVKKALETTGNVPDYVAAYIVNMLDCKREGGLAPNMELRELESWNRT